MFKLGALIWIMLATVLAGFAVVAIVSVPALEAQSRMLIPAAAAAAAVIAIPIARLISKSMQASMHAQT